MIYLFAIISIVLGAVAQFCLKMGVMRSEFDSHIQPEKIPGLLLDVWFLSGIAAYGLSMIIWLYVLSRLELSKAYPLVSIGYILTTAMACIWLGESLNWQKSAGIILIICGVFLISRS